MQPGTSYPITIEAFATSTLFRQAHGIRIDISSSNFPHFVVNPNTGGPEGKARSHRIATNRVFVDRDRASYLLLPLIP